MVGGKTVPQPSGVVRRLPRAGVLFYLPPPKAFPLFIPDMTNQQPDSKMSMREFEVSDRPCEATLLTTWLQECLRSQAAQDDAKNGIPPYRISIFVQD